jgi:hypothetical protein
MQRKQQKKHERGEERDVTVDEDFFGEDIVFIIKISSSSFSSISSLLPLHALHRVCRVIIRRIIL